jgi:hypothetical protein
MEDARGTGVGGERQGVRWRRIRGAAGQEDLRDNQKRKSNGVMG